MSGFASLLACTGGLHDADYRGEPAFTLSGQVVMKTGEPPSEAIGLGLMWLAPDGSSLSEQNERLTTSFPAQYQLELFATPPDEAFAVEGGDLAVGRVVLFEDDGDDLWQPDTEAIVGSSVSFVLYLRDEGAFPAGFGVYDAPPGQAPRPENVMPRDPTTVDLVFGEGPDGP